jgi:hypothetical protein
MEKVYKCSNDKKLKITYRVPNAIEHYNIRADAGFGSEENSNRILANLIKLFGEYFVSCSDSRSWDEIIADPKLFSDVSTLGNLLVNIGVDDDEKK